MSDLRQYRITGHIGELLQGRLGLDGPVALITLPCPELALEVSQHPGPLELVQPQKAVISVTDMRRLLTLLDSPPQGRFTFRAKMPVGAGAGASTAAILAVIKLVRPDLPRSEAERICLAVEGASDPLLAQRPERVLWASRQARVLDQMPPLPRMRVIGGFFGQAQPTDPGDEHFPDISDLVTAWPEACQSAADCARLASISASRTRALRREGAGDLAALAEASGALGFSIAHTGSAQCLLFDTERDRAPVASKLSQMGWRYVQDFVIGGREDSGG